MNHQTASAVAFGAILRENPAAARFYDNCTPAQREAILLQLQELPPENIRAFVEELPSAAL
ncbi:MAG: hypothetical protein HFE97_12755 [Oscillospiraceae bacterium]|nr:hypothetical protein [Oscillospiraceae bacterium]